jgi:hypothetical protein
LGYSRPEPDNAPNVSNPYPIEKHLLHERGENMSLPMVTLISGISGVLIVMLVLLVMVTLSSKLAIFIEKRNENTSQND